MTVRLLTPWAGLAIGELYDGDDQNYLVNVGKADGELSRGRQITVPGTSHTLTLSDQFRERVFTNANAVTIRIPLKAVQDAPFGIIGTFRQGGAGAVSVVGDNGVTVQATTGFAKSGGQGAVFQIDKIGAQTIAVFGALATS